MPAGLDVAALYRTHAPVVFRRARQLLKSDAEAHEVVQDLFLSIHQRPEQCPAEGARTAWFYSATTHACLNHLRNGRNRLRLLSEQLAPEDHGAAQVEARSLSRQLLSRMPEPLAVLAVYYYVDELTQEQVAALLGCSRRHVNDLVSRLRAWLTAQEAS
jgi:RNA polymerase sigma factor (sigma-70 family)